MTPGERQARREAVEAGMEEISARGRARMAAAGPHFRGLRVAEVDWLEHAELEELHRLGLELASLREPLGEIRARVAAKRAARLAGIPHGGT